jgi:hypothetical protein
MAGSRDARLAPDAVYEMDCLQGLQRISPGSVDLAFADPPFNIGLPGAPTDCLPPRDSLRS